MSVSTKVYFNDLTYVQEIEKKLSTLTVNLEEKTRALEESENKFRSYIDKCPDGIFIFDLDGRHIAVNPAACIITGYTESELLSLTASDIFMTRHSQCICNLTGVASFSGEMNLVRKDGRIVIVDVLTVELEKDKCIGFIRDITVRKGIEEELRKSHVKINNILESITDGFLAVDGSWRIIYANRTAQQLIKRPVREIINCCIPAEYPQLIGTDLFRQIERAMVERRPISFEYFFRPASTWYEINAYPAPDGGISIYFRDISENKRLKEEMARLDRLNLVGQMSAGIGHEIRNPMTTVRGFLQMLSMRDEQCQDKEFYDLMIQELDRANSIITEFLSLAQNKDQHLETKNLNHILETICPLLISDAYENNMEIVLDQEPVPDLLLDEREIRQLIFNLVRNGIEAMSPGGIIYIKVRKKGEHVILTVQDEGKGIPPELRHKIGTPFFTTKDNGTGLGLAVCYSIANRHQAKIKFDSCADGTTFSVKFKINMVNPKAI